MQKKNTHLTCLLLTLICLTISIYLMTQFPRLLIIIKDQDRTVSPLFPSLTPTPTPSHSLLHFHFVITSIISFSTLVISSYFTSLAYNYMCAPLKFIPRPCCHLESVRTVWSLVLLIFSLGDIKDPLRFRSPQICLSTSVCCTFCSFF